MTVIESLHEYRFNQYEIRFWQHEADLSGGLNWSRDALEDWSRTKSYYSLDDVLNFLSSLEYCNAVQIRDMTDNFSGAFLIYPEWP